MARTAETLQGESAQTQTASELGPSHRKRILVAGAIGGALPWGVLSLFDGSLILMVVAYFVLAAVLPFLTALHRPAGPGLGGRVGMRVVLTSWVFLLGYTLAFTLYKQSWTNGAPWLYGRPFYALILTTVLLPLLLPVALFAGSVGGTRPQDVPSKAPRPDENADAPAEKPRRSR